MRSVLSMVGPLGRLSEFAVLSLNRYLSLVG